MGKYTGSNSYKLGYLPLEVRQRYAAGLLSDDDIDGLLSQAQSATRSPTTAELGIGPQTEEQQSFVQGLEDAGGVDAGTARAAAAGSSGALRTAGQGIEKMLREGAFLGQTGLGSYDMVMDAARNIPGVADREDYVKSVWRELTGADSEEVQKQEMLDRAAREGRQTSIELAKLRGNAAEDLLIDLAPQATQVGTTLAALVASRNPALAATIGSISIADIGTKVAGTSYLEGREAGYSPEQSLERARLQLGAEVGSEFLPFGALKKLSTSFSKNFLKAVATGTAEELAAEMANMGIDYAKFQKLAPKDQEEVWSRLGEAAKLGVFGTGAIATPGVLAGTAHKRAQRVAEGMLRTESMDPNYADGLRTAMDAEQAVKDGWPGVGPIGTMTPEQKDLLEDTFGPTPEMDALMGRRRQEQLEKEALAQVEKQKKAERDKVTQDLKTKARVRENYATTQGEGSMAERVGASGLLDKYTPTQEKRQTPSSAVIDGEQGSLPLDEPKQPKTRMERVKDAMAREQKTKEAAENKKVADRERALRQKIERDIVSKYPNISPTEFDAAVKMRLKNEMAKPAEAAPVKPTKKTAPVKASKKKQTETITPEQIEKDQIFSLKDKSDGGGLTREAVVKKFAFDESAEGNAFRKALRSGRVKIVQSESQLGFDVPKGARVKGVHIADTGEITLVADSLDETTLMPTLQHEVKHHMDRKHGDSGKGSMKYVVGEKANEKLIGQIKSLAKGGNTIASEAVDRFNSAYSVNKEGTGQDEIVTYFLEATGRARKNGKILGGARNVIEDAVRGAKLFLKEKRGLDANVDARDLEYLSRQMINDLGKGTYKDQYEGKVALNPKVEVQYEAKAKDGSKPNATFSLVGPSFEGYADLDSKEFLGRDRLRRKELHTGDVELKDSGLGEFASGVETVKLDKVLDFPELYKGYPWAKNISVVEDPVVPSAAWRGVEDKVPVLQIRVSPNLIRRARKDSVGKESLRSILLHELQHAIQDKENFARGDSPFSYLSDEEFDAAIITGQLPPRALKEYYKSEGEAEARTVEARSRYTRAERAATPFAETTRKSNYANANGQYDPENSRVTRALRPAFSIDLKPYDGKKPISTGSVVEFVHGFTDAYSAKLDKSIRRGIVQSSKKIERKDGTAFFAHWVTPFTGHKAGGTVLLGPTEIMSIAPPASSASFSLADDTLDLAPQRTRGFGRNQNTNPIRLGKNLKIDRESSSGRVLDTMDRVFAGGRVPTEFREVTERALGEKNESALKAMNALNRINTAIAGSSNPEQASKRLREMENTENRAARVEKANALKRDMPEVFEAYNDARRRIYEMSKEILGLMRREGYNPTKKELAVINSIESKLGNYLTTTYKMFGPKKVRVAHHAWLHGTKDGKQRRADAEEWAANNIFSLDDINDKSQDWLEAMYDALVPGSMKAKRPSETMGRKELIEVLEQAAPGLSAADVKTASEKFVEDLVRLGDAAKEMGKAARIYRGASQDMTVITPKMDVPPVIRKLWGEQDNPVMNVFATLIRQGEFVSRAKMQFRALDELSGKYLFDRSNDIPKGIQAVQLKSDSFGPLAGKWTTPEVAQYLQDQQEAFGNMNDIVDGIFSPSGPGKENQSAGAAVGKALGALGRAGSFYKWMSVVWRPSNWLLNYWGSGMQLVSNGNFGSNVAKGHKIAWSEAPGAPFSDYSSDGMLEVLRNGVLDNSLVGEIQEAERRSLIEGLLEKNVQPNQLLTPQRFQQTANMITDYYAASDVWAKVANYFREKEFVTNLYKSLGQEVSAETIERTAAERIRATNFTFNRAYSPAKFLERNGITNFLTYNTETFRTLANNYMMAYSDIAKGKKLEKEGKTEAAKMLKQHGIKRLAGVSAATSMHVAIFTSLGKVLSYMMDWDEEDETEEAIKQGLPDYAANKQLVLVSKDGAKRQYFEVGRIDPFGPANDLSRATYAALTGDVSKAMDAATGMFIMNNMLKEVIGYTSTLQEGTQKAQPPRIKNISEKGYMAIREALTDWSEYIPFTDGLTPNTVDRIMRSAESIMPSVIPHLLGAVVDTEEQNPYHRFYKALGGSFLNIDLEEQVKNQANFDYRKKIQESRNYASDWIRTQTKFDPEDVQNLYEEVTKDELSAWNDILPRVEAAELAGVTRRQLQNLLKDSGLNTEQINSLTRKKFYPTIFSDNKLDGDRDTEVDAAEKEDRAGIRSKHRKFRQEIKRLNRNFKTLDLE